MKSNSVTVREVDTAFAPQLTDLWARTFTEAYANDHTAENIQAYCKKNFTEPLASAALANPETRCSVAFRGLTPIGFTLIQHHKAPYFLPGRASELKQIYVILREHGTGVGAALLKDSMSAITVANRDWIWLLVSTKNYRARRFYDKHELKLLGTGETIHVGSDTLASLIIACRVQS